MALAKKRRRLASMGSTDGGSSWPIQFLSIMVTPSDLHRRVSNTADLFGRLWRSGVLADHVGSLLADHDGGCVGVAADQRGHDRRVDHAQAGDAVYTQSLVDYRHAVAAHLASAHRVVLR